MSKRFLNAQGETASLQAVLLDAKGQTLDPKAFPLVWSSSRTSDFSVDQTGQAIALVEEGFSEISVQLQGTELTAKQLLSISVGNGSTSFPGPRPPTPNPTPSPSAPPLTTHPIITAISPSQGDVAGGTQVTITGLNFSGTTAVMFGSTPAPAFTVVSHNQITATVPAGMAGDVQITVTSPEGTSTPTAASRYTYTTPAPYGFVINGINTMDLVGVSVTHVGDLNGDGISDLLIGSQNANPGNTGSAYIVYGGTRASDTLDLSEIVNGDGSQGFVITGVNTDQYFGLSVTRIGDFNGDGRPDFAIGSPGANFGIGRAYIVYSNTFSGSHLDLSALESGNGSQGFVVNGEATTGLGNLGFAIAGGGDINGDGRPDLIVSAQGYALAQGRVYVIYGGAITSGSLNATDLSGGDGSLGFVINGEQSADYFGIDVTAAGDVNGDGFADLLIGAYGRDSEQGAAYLVYGGASLAPELNMTDISAGDNSQGMVIDGEFASDQFGSTLSAADINGDGYSDLIMGMNKPGGVNGRAYVVYGRNNLPAELNLADIVSGNGSQGFVFTDSTAQNGLGIKVSALPDMNGDGKADLLIAAPDILRASTGASPYGQVFVVYSNAITGNNFDVSTLGTGNGSRGYEIRGLTNEAFGSSLSATPDLNGDGIPDLLIGALLKDGFKGAAYVVYGKQNAGGLQDLNPSPAPSP